MRAPLSSPDDLLRVKFHDQLFLDLFRDVRPRREDLDVSPEVLPVQLEPSRDPLPDNRIHRLVDRGILPALLLQLDDVARPDEERGNVHPLSPDREVTVPHELPALPAGHREAELVRDVVQPAFQEDQEVVARLPLQLLRLLEVVVELPLEQAVDPFRLLLLPKLDPVVAVLGTPLPVLSRGIPSPLDGALVGEAPVPLQEQLDPFSPA